MPLSYLAPPMPMDGFAVVADDRLDPPARIFERLRQIAGYTWDESQRPFHSTYDNWYCSPLSENVASWWARRGGKIQKIQQRESVTDITFLPICVGI